MIDGVLPHVHATRGRDSWPHVNALHVQDISYEGIAGRTGRRSDTCRAEAAYPSYRLIRDRLKADPIMLRELAKRWMATFRMVGLAPHWVVGGVARRDGRCSSTSAPYVLVDLISGFCLEAGLNLASFSVMPSSGRSRRRPG